MTHPWQNATPSDYARWVEEAFGDDNNGGNEMTTNFIKCGKCGDVKWCGESLPSQTLISCEKCNAEPSKEACFDWLAAQLKTAVLSFIEWGGSEPGVEVYGGITDKLLGSGPTLLVAVRDAMKNEAGKP